MASAARLVQHVRGSQYLDWTVFECQPSPGQVGKNSNSEAFLSRAHASFYPMANQEGKCNFEGNDDMYGMGKSSPVARCYK